MEKMELYLNDAQMYPVMMEPRNLIAVMGRGTGKGMIDGLTEIQRSYRVQSNEKYFLPQMLGNSLFADCLDGTEFGVRLDWYKADWEVDYCYLEEGINE